MGLGKGLPCYRMLTFILASYPQQAFQFSYNICHKLNFKSLVGLYLVEHIPAYFCAALASHLYLMVLFSLCYFTIC